MTALTEPALSPSGRSKGTRDRYPDDIRVGDTITWVDRERVRRGVVTGREGNPYVAVVLVGRTRVYRRQVTLHLPSSWTPPASLDIPPQDLQEEQAASLVEARQQHGWDEALRVAGLSHAEGVRRWSLAIDRGWAS
ncbi:hypothetical protein EDD28_0548 [Salana multivorans]|uniref:Uncharacterized protein n=1 Tax=Salana multivorans TaxID=120377 RepID=A0A3N2D8L5_9MICO|nr:hypothetical protein [Salana multivorans]ROR95978.1 hypothetical protein EDD28_0548 [Salana multivorans]